MINEICLFSAGHTFTMLLFSMAFYRLLVILKEVLPIYFANTITQMINTIMMRSHCHVCVVSLTIALLSALKAYAG